MQNVIMISTISLSNLDNILYRNSEENHDAILAYRYFIKEFGLSADGSTIEDLVRTAMCYKGNHITRSAMLTLVPYIWETIEDIKKFDEEMKKLLDLVVR